VQPPLYLLVGYCVSVCEQCVAPLAFHWVKTLEVTALLCEQTLRVSAPFHLCLLCGEICSPLARVILKGCHLLKHTQQFSSVLCWDKGLYTVQFSVLKVSWGKGFTVWGFGAFLGLCFLPVGLLLGGKKASSFFGMRSIRVLGTEPLSDNNSNGSSSLLLAVTSSEVRIRTRYVIYPPFQIWNVVLSSIQFD